MTLSRMTGYGVYTVGSRDDVNMALITSLEIKRTLFAFCVCVCVCVCVCAHERERSVSTLMVRFLLIDRITRRARMSCVHACVYCIYMAYLYLCAI